MDFGEEGRVWEIRVEGLVSFFEGVEGVEDVVFGVGGL